MEDLEDAVSQLLQVRLLGSGRLKDAWLSEDDDEGGHEPLKKHGVHWAGNVGIEVVAQGRCGFDLEPKLYNGMWSVGSTYRISG